MSRKRHVPIPITSSAKRVINKWSLSESSYFSGSHSRMVAAGLQTVERGGRAFGEKEPEGGLLSKPVKQFFEPRYLHN